MTHARKLIRTIHAGLGLLIGATLLTGCASFKLKDPPPGFIEVSSSDWGGEAELRMKAPDNVGLNITTFSNFRGGKLPLWADDLVKKLGARGYELVRQTPVKSGNGVAGTRFDFAYTPPGTEERKFYTAVLFVTDEWRIVVQLGGQADLESAHAGDLDAIVRRIKIRGCKAGSDTCDGPQPIQLSTPTKAKPKSDAKKDTDAKKDADAKTDTDEKTDTDANPDG